jgi:large subunit ribosomal protein L21
MFAIVEIQGKQFRVVAGDTIEVERMAGKIGDSVSFERVLLVSGEKAVKIGTPVVKGAVVKAKILSHDKGEKLEVRRYKNKVRYRKHTGFRQQLTKLEIVSIS